MSHQHIACCKLKNIGMLRQQWFLAGWASDGHFEQDFQGGFAISLLVPLSSYKTRPLKRVAHSTALLLYAQSLRSPPEGHEYVRIIPYCTFAFCWVTLQLTVSSVTSSTPKLIDAHFSPKESAKPFNITPEGCYGLSSWISMSFWGIYCTVLGGWGNRCRIVGLGAYSLLLQLFF